MMRSLSRRSLALALMASSAAAVSLPTTPESDLVDLLDGCDVVQLVTLCRRLADECDRRAVEEV